MRTTFVAALGEGAFGKVHLATYTDGLEYFNNNQDSSRKMKQQFVAVKELHGKLFSLLLLLLLLLLLVVVVVVFLVFLVVLVVVVVELLLLLRLLVLLLSLLRLLLYNTGNL